MGNIRTKVPSEIGEDYETVEIYETNEKRL